MLRFDFPVCRRVTCPFRIMSFGGAMSPPSSSAAAAAAAAAAMGEVDTTHSSRGAFAASTCTTSSVGAFSFAPQASSRSGRGWAATRSSRSRLGLRAGGTSTGLRSNRTTGTSLSFASASRTTTTTASSAQSAFSASAFHFGGGAAAPSSSAWSSATPSTGTFRTAPTTTHATCTVCSLPLDGPDPLRLVVRVEDERGRVDSDRDTWAFCNWRCVWEFAHMMQ